MGIFDGFSYRYSEDRNDSISNYGLSSLIMQN